MYYLILHFFLWLFQFLPDVQQPSRADEEFQVEEQNTTSDDQERKTHEKELEHTDEEQFAEKEEIIEGDRAKEESGFDREPAAEESEWPVEEPGEEIQTPSEELDDEIEEDVAEEQEEVDIRVERKKKTLQEAHVDEIQTALKDSDHVTYETGEIMDEKVKVPIEEETKIHSTNMITRESEKQIEAAALEEIQTPLEDSSTTTSAIEEAAVEKQEEPTPAQEMQADVLTHIIEEDFSEEPTEHAVEEIHSVSNEVLTAEMKTREKSNAEQVSETAEETQTPLDIDTNQIKDAVPGENEQEAVESDEESLISEKSVEDV